MTTEKLDRLDQRRRYLTQRIAAKKRVGWEHNYDRDERDALAAALKFIRRHLKTGANRER
jgi:hypothetical protein